MVATGTGTLTNQWQGDFGTGWNDLYRETNSTLVVVNVQTEADYRVVVSDAIGTTTSDVAHLYVTAPPAKPSITAQPTNSSVSLGATAVNRVGVSGTSPFSYQWRFNGAPLPGRTLNSITLPNVQLADAGNYDVVVTNIAGSITSRVAVLRWTRRSPRSPKGRSSMTGSTLGMDTGGTTTTTGDWMCSFPATAGQWRLYHNDGGTMFSTVTNGVMGEYNLRAMWGIWADPDNDDDLDMFADVHRGSTINMFWNDGGGNFTRVPLDGSPGRVGGRVPGVTLTRTDS